MLDKREVYLMIRTKSNEAKIIVSRPMFNARSVESRLHKKWSNSRFVMTKKIKYRKWFQNHVKIGIAKNTSSRRSQVSKDIFKSGKTEWFAISDIELVFLKIDLWWHSKKVYFSLLFLGFITLLIVILINYNTA